MTLPKSGLRAQVIAAVVFVTFAAGIVVVARSFRTAADAALGPDGDEAPRPPAAPRRGPLTPKSATTAGELRAALHQVFGNNARGMALATYADYDRHPDRLHLTLSLDNGEVTAPGATPAALRRTRDVLETLYDGDMQWTWVLVTGTAPVRDRSGNVSESTVLRVQFSRDRLRRLDWAKVTPEELQAAAEQYWVNLDLGR